MRVENVDRVPARVAEADVRAQTRSGLVRTVRARWSWEGVAAGVIAAAQGELGELREP